MCVGSLQDNTLRVLLRGMRRGGARHMLPATRVRARWIDFWRRAVALEEHFAMAVQLHYFPIKARNALPLVIAAAGL